jgi:hypothetical protein
MSAVTMPDVGVLVVASCAVCGTRHAFDQAINDRALNSRGLNGRQIYCPNGHSWHYLGKTEAQVERERAERAERDRDAARQSRDYETQRADRETRRAVAMKGVVTRTKRRIAAGKCPCCHKRFGDVAEHMTAEHPGYGTDA